MDIKKHNWMDNSQNSDFLEISVKDWGNKKIDFFRVNNNKDYKRILSLLRNKYGFGDNNSGRKMDDEPDFLNPNTDF